MSARWRRPFVAILRRLLDPTRRTDLAFAAMLATWPAVLAALIGAHRSVTVQGIAFAGYWERPNWLIHIAALPLALYLFRWAADKIVPVWEPWPPQRAPEVIRLIDSERGQARAYAAMQATVLSPFNLLAAAAAMVAFHVLDMAEVLAVYSGRLADVALVREPDWAVVGAFAPGVSALGNALLVLSAYSVQFTELTLMVLFVVLVLRHNLFFLGRIFQARRVARGDEDAYIVIDLDDANRCLGFRRANEAFNTQVVCVTVSGIGLLTSRFANVTVLQNRALWDAITPGGRALDSSLLAELFPDVGQWVTALAWLAALTIIALPALVKLLPRIPFTGGAAAQRSIVTYLREFLPAARWPFATEPTVEQVNWLAGRFADNAFWPTGNNRAGQLFLFSLWVFLVILFPLSPGSGRTPALLAFYAALGMLALAGTWLTLQLLRWALAYVDVRLVTPPTVMMAATVSGPMPSMPVSGAGAPTALPSLAVERSVGTGSRLGEFEILSHLGSGGMGAVFRAEDTRLGRQVALKVLPTEFTSDAQRLARFEREAKLLASLNHPNIATLYSFDQDGPIRFITMELVEGNNLAERLEDGPMSLSETVRVGAEMCSALEQAHRRGIVHRDLKPANVMLTETGSKLLDFGLAKGSGLSSSAGGGSAESKTALTTTGTIVGTLHYMSPEQLQGAATIDHRTDIFALGAVLYEMATGTRAFPGTSQATVIGEVLHREPPPIAELQPQLPTGLDAVVRRCLAKRAADRFQEVAAVRLALIALTSAELAAPAAASGELALVAVLSFAWASGTAAQTAIANGLVDELRVLVADGYAGPLAAPGAATADLVVQGSLRAAGERVRAAVQLIDSASGRQLWAARYEATLGDAFALQDELAEVIARDLLPRLQDRN